MMGSDPEETESDSLGSMVDSDYDSFAVGLFNFLAW